MPPQSVRWNIGSFGKPHLLDSDGIWFNVSHSGNHLLLALSSRYPIGADIEAGTTLASHELAELADRCFTHSDRKGLSALDHSERGAAFLRCWTRKEACLKAVGSGLSIEPNSFEVGLTQRSAKVTIPSGKEVCTVNVISLPLPLGLAGAVAVLAEESRHLAL